jgi:hypothetical protein
MRGHRHLNRTGYGIFERSIARCVSQIDVAPVDIWRKMLMPHVPGPTCSCHPDRERRPNGTYLYIHHRKIREATR